MQIKIFTKFNTIYDKGKNSPKSRHRSKMMWCAESLQSCPTLCNPMNYSPAGFSVHGILQARILGWVVMPSSRESSWPRDQTWVSCTAGRFFTTEPSGKPIEGTYFNTQKTHSKYILNGEKLKTFPLFFNAIPIKLPMAFFTKLQKLFHNL